MAQALKIALAVLAVLLFGPSARAESFPARPITIIVPFAAGGAADVNGRITAEALTQRLGQPVIVENLAGAGGTIGGVKAKNAKNNGYPLLFGHMGTVAAAVSLYPQLGYDPRTDFEPIGLISFSPIVLFSRKDLPVGNLGEFLAYAKAQGDKLSDGHSGVGSISHITCALLASLGGYSPTFVPYRGVGPMINDMLGGNVDFRCDLVPAVSQHIKAGKLKGIAIASAERSSALPDVPTSSEGSLPEFRADAWTGLFAPKGVPADILDKLRSALVESVDNPQTQARL